MPTQGDRTRASLQNPRTSSQDYANWANQQPQQTSGQDYANWANQQPGKLATGYATDPSSGAIYDPQGNVYESPGSGFSTKGGALYDTQGNVYESAPATGGAAAGGGGKGMMGNIGSGIGSALSGIASALSNVPSWKMQPSAIPAPPAPTKANYNFQTPSA
jgi:hypothetical protein